MVLRRFWFHTRPARSGFAVIRLVVRPGDFLVFAAGALVVAPHEFQADAFAAEVMNEPGP